MSKKGKKGHPVGEANEGKSPSKKGFFKPMKSENALQGGQDYLATLGGFLVMNTATKMAKQDNVVVNGVGALVGVLGAGFIENRYARAASVGVALVSTMKLTRNLAQENIPLFGLAGDENATVAPKTHALPEKARKFIASYLTLNGEVEDFQQSGVDDKELEEVNGYYRIPAKILPQNGVSGLELLGPAEMSNRNTTSNL